MFRCGHVVQASGDISGGKAACEEGKNAAQQGAACMREAQESQHAACRQEAQASELAMHAKLLHHSVKVLPHHSFVSSFYHLLDQCKMTSRAETFSTATLCCRRRKVRVCSQHSALL